MPARERFLGIGAFPSRVCCVHPSCAQRVPAASLLPALGSLVYLAFAVVSLPSVVRTSPRCWGLLPYTKSAWHAVKLDPPVVWRDPGLIRWRSPDANSTTVQHPSSDIESESYCLKDINALNCLLEGALGIYLMGPSK